MKSYFSLAKRVRGSIMLVSEDFFLALTVCVYMCVWWWWGGFSAMTSQCDTVQFDSEHLYSKSFTDSLVHQSWSKLQLSAFFYRAWRRQPARGGVCKRPTPPGCCATADSRTRPPRCASLRYLPPATRQPWMCQQNTGQVWTTSELYSVDSYVTRV